MRSIWAACILLLAQSALAQVDATSVNYKHQTITIALSQEPPQLNNMKATDQVSIFVLGHIMEGLVRYNRYGKLVPGIAKRWKMTDTSATFWLRHNARWSDGEPVTAHDFIFAWRNALKPSTASEYAFILYPIKNAKKINDGKLPVTALGAEAQGNYIIHVQLAHPTAYFLKLGAFPTYYPVKQSFYDKQGENYAGDADKMLYDGPFKLVSWQHGASLKMVKNPMYWDAKDIKLNAINVAYITADTRARLNLFIDGKIAYTTLDGDTYREAMREGLRIRAFTTGSVFYLGYNFRKGHPTRDVNLRKAIQHIFDPDEFVNRVLGTPGNLPGVSLFPVWLNGVHGKFRQEYPAPRAKISEKLALKYLAKAKADLGVEKIPPLVLLVGDSPTASKQAQYLQGLLESRLGLVVKIDAQTFKQRLAMMTAGDYDMVQAGWGPDFNDIMTFGNLFASWNLNNRGRYSNPVYDHWVQVASNTNNEKIRMNAMAHCQQILFNDAVILPEYEQGQIYVVNPRLRGMVRRVVGADPDFTHAYVIPRANM